MVHSCGRQQRPPRRGQAASRPRVGPFVARWLVAASLVSGCASTGQPVAPIVAVIQAVENQVEAHSANAATQLTAAVGTGLPTGSTLSTGDQSAAVIGFGDSNAVHLASLTAVTLLRIVQLGSGATVHLQLERGRLLGSAPGGWLVVETILAQVSLAGAAAELEYGVGGFDPQDDILIVRCLMSACEVQSRLGARSLGPGEQLAITDGGMSVHQSELSEAEVDFILGDDVAGVLSAATLTAWPAIQFGATATLPPSSTLTATITLVPSNTPTTTHPPATLTRTSNPSATATATPTPVTPTRQPPTRTPTSSPTLQPNSATSPAQPPPPGPMATPPPSSVPPTIPPSPTLAPSTGAVPSPTMTPQPPPTKTPVQPPTKTPSRPAPPRARASVAGLRRARNPACGRIIGQRSRFRLPARRRVPRQEKP